MANESFIDRFILSFSIRALLFKFFTGFILIIVFAFEELRVNGDEVFKNSTKGVWQTLFSFDMLVALWQTYRDAVIKAIASLFPVFSDIASMEMQFINNMAYVSLAFAGVIFFLLIMQYQSFVALAMNFFVPEWSDGTMFFMSFILTGAIIVLLSVFLTIILGVNPTLFSTAISNTTDVIRNTTTNTTTSEGFVIDLT